MTKTKSGRGILSLIAIATVITAGVMFSGQWHTSNGKAAPSPDEPRTLRLTVSWWPSPRTQLVAAYYTVNAIADRPSEVSRESPWVRLVTLRRGDALLLQADQMEPGTLKCEIHEGRKRIAHKETDLPGHIACGAPAL